MANKNIKILDSLVSRTKIYLIIILVLLVMICTIKPVFIVPSIIIYTLIIGYTYFANNKRKSEISEQLQDLTLTVDSAAKSSLINSPFPLIIVETDGNVVWRSSKFISEFANVDINNYINDLILDVKEEIKKENKDKSILVQVKIGKKDYKIIGQFTKSKRKIKEHMMVFYFIDETKYVKLQEDFRDSKTCVGIIRVDNYEEIMQMIDSDDKTQIMAEIEKNIYEWVNETNGIVVKSDRDTYV